MLTHLVTSWVVTDQPTRGALENALKRDADTFALILKDLVVTGHANPELYNSIESLPSRGDQSISSLLKQVNWEEVAESFRQSVAQSQVRAFIDPKLDMCGSPSAHIWDGPELQFDREGGSTCSKCGIYFGDFAMWCLP